LMQAVTTPIFGKLADLFGRKPVFLAGVALFLLGSMLCGIATSMEMLIVFRLFQGVGAGSVMPISSTLASDLYALEERGRVQGYLSSVWGISSVVGPLAGGLIIQNADWHWIFWLNVPFGVVAMLLIALFLHEDVQREARDIDFAGAALLLVGLSALMLALTQGESWGLGIAGMLVALSAAVLFLFLRQQRRAPDPMMRLDLWSNPIIRVGNLAILIAGIAMIGLITFLPTFVQGVLGRSALVAGFTLSAMSLGWPLASMVAGHLFVRIGVRTIVRMGGVFAAAGSLAVALFAEHGPIAAGCGSFLLGVGLGLLSTTIIVAIQSSVSWGQRGVATASNMLMRNLGNAVGAALLGGLLNFRLGSYIEEHGAVGQISLDSVRDLVGGIPHDDLGAGALDLLRDGLAQGLGLVFWMIFALAVATLLVSWRIPNLHPAENL
ncbi:MAG TPA: MFS transporter, partial [Longimicrobiaceae bacterium]|nr:MFS transporter [Longimicrobiaceae bacterium]